MDRTTVEFGRWMLKRIDALNWQLFERKEKTRGKNAGEVGWVGMPNYFGQLVDGVAFARNREMERKGEFETLDGYIAELRRVDEQFAKALKKAAS